MFRFDYSPDFLKWALQPPGWLQDWHVGVRVVKSKKLVGFISAIPANVRIYDRYIQFISDTVLAKVRKILFWRFCEGFFFWGGVAKLYLQPQNPLIMSLYSRILISLTPSSSCRTKKMVEINFLCVHKKLRSKRVAPVLIREITRRVNRQGLFQAVYTAGVVLPKPVATCR